MWETSPYTVVLQAGLGAAPGVLVVEKLNVSWQCALVAWKAKCILDRIRSGVSSRAGSGLSLSAIVRLHLQYLIQVWSCWHEEDMSCL